jgi:hypothetical protein
MFELLGYIVMAWLLYRLINAWVIVQNIKSAMADTVQELEPGRELMVVFEKVEQNGHSVVLCFDQENNFVAQGATQEEVIKLACQRYPAVNISTYKNEELQWIKTKSEKSLPNG